MIAWQVFHEIKHCGSGEELIVGEGRFQQTVSYHAWIMVTHFLVIIWRDWQNMFSSRVPEIGPEKTIYIIY